METPRRVLEVSETATREEIRASYRLLCLVWHPDRMVTLPAEARERAATKMREVVAAYQELTREFPSAPPASRPRSRAGVRPAPSPGFRSSRRRSLAVAVATLLGVALLLLLMGLPGRRVAVERETMEEPLATKPRPAPEQLAPAPGLGDDGLSLTTPRAAGFYRPPARRGSGS